MSAVIVDLALARATRTGKACRVPSVASLMTGRAAETAVFKTPFLFWTGASGARYVHSVYNLFDCPPVEGANYILVKRHSNGQRTVISIGRATNEAATLNLAEIRLRSAQLGANEVHIHLLAGSLTQSQHIESDLRGSLALA